MRKNMRKGGKEGEEEEEEEEDEEEERQNKGLIKRMENDGVWCQMCALCTTNKHCQ